jgi:Protein of unknown function (DUF1367)
LKLAAWIRRGPGLYPANEEAQQMLASLTIGKLYLGKFKTARSVKQLNLWWSLCGLLADHSIFPSADAASDTIKIACGHTEIRIEPDSGKVHMVPKSIAFQSLSQHAFNEIFNTALDVIVDRWMDGTQSEELRREAFARIDGPKAIGTRIAA